MRLQVGFMKTLSAQAAAVHGELVAMASMAVVT